MKWQLDVSGYVILLNKIAPKPSSTTWLSPEDKAAKAQAELPLTLALS